MKILHIMDHLGLGGAQRALLDLLETRGADVDPIVWSLSDRTVPEATRRLQSAGVPCRFLGLRPSRPLRLLKLRSLIEAEAADVVHTHLEYSSTIGVAAASRARGRRPLIVGHVDNDPLEAYGPAVRFAARRLAPRVALHIAVSESLRRSTERAYRGRARRIEVIEPGIDLERFDRTRVPAGEIERLRRGARRVVGSVGRLARQKGLDVLLDALPRLLDAEPRTRLLLVGEGPERAALEARALRLGVADSVTFLGYLEETAPAYAAMDAFVLPSRHEGFGIAFLEAMAIGVPVIGTRVVGSVDAVEDGATGLLVPPGDSDALAGAALELLGNAELSARLAGEAGRRVRVGASRDLVARRTESLYGELLEARKR